MSLVTRCPACSTLFKVVADQLKVSQGWVRCGQCGEVFDASASLQRHDLALPAAPAASPISAGASPEPQSVLDAAPDAEPTAPAAAPPPGPYRDAPADAESGSPQPASSEMPEMREKPQAPAPQSEYRADGEALIDASLAPYQDEAAFLLTPVLAQPVVDQDVGEQAVVLAKSAQPVEPTEQPQGAAPPLAEAPPAAVSPETAAGEMPITPITPESLDGNAATVADVPTATDEEVSFVRDALRQAFWRRPAVRALLGLASLLLAALLLGQVALHERDAIAAKAPHFKPALQALCSAFDCRIAPPRQIDRLVIDSSSFTKLAPEVYRLGFSIKNNASVALAMPFLEVTLTDTRDQALLRKALSPAELGATSDALPAGAEFSGSLQLELSNPSAGDIAARTAGYRLLAFYP